MLAQGWYFWGGRDLLIASDGKSHEFTNLRGRQAAGAPGGIRPSYLLLLLFVSQVVSMPLANAQYKSSHSHQHKSSTSKSATAQPKPKTQEEMMQMLDQVESGGTVLKPGHALPATRPMKGYGHLQGYSAHRVAPAAGGAMPYGGGGLGQQAMQAMPPGGRQAAALEALRRQAQAMGGGQQMLMRMMQQGGQGAPGGAQGFPMMNQLQQRMQAQGTQGGGGVAGNSAVFQRLQQRMQGMNGGGGAPSAGFNPPQVTSAPGQSKRGFLGVFNNAKSNGAAQSGDGGGDLEKQMEGMYGK
jgi:hypothetical protein